MLIGLDPLLGPDLLWTLRAMGHGDDLAIVDANFPAQTMGARVLRLDGISATDALEAVLSVFPLDSFVEDAAHVMEVVGRPDETPPAVAEFERLIGSRTRVGRLERFAFYERAKGAFAILQTGEARLYGNVILKKGVVA